MKSHLAIYFCYSNMMIKSISKTKLAVEMEVWRQKALNGELIIAPHNNKTKETEDGKVWHLFDNKHHA